MTARFCFAHNEQGCYNFIHSFMVSQGSIACCSGSLLPTGSFLSGSVCTPLPVCITPGTSPLPVGVCRSIWSLRPFSPPGSALKQCLAFPPPFSRRACTVWCLILVGLFFAAPLYRMNLLTIGDFYKKKFGRSVEVLTTIAIVISYLGWVGAQITALGLVFNVVSGGDISKVAGMWIGSGTTLIYTFFGGMWAVAVTDLIQMIIICIGMLYIGGSVSNMVGGVGVVVNHALAAGKFDFWPALD